MSRVRIVVCARTLSLPSPSIRRLVRCSGLRLEIRLVCSDSSLRLPHSICICFCDCLPLILSYHSYRESSRLGLLSVAMDWSWQEQQLPILAQDGSELADAKHESSIRLDTRGLGTHNERGNHQDPLVSRNGAVIRRKRSVLRPSGLRDV